MSESAKTDRVYLDSIRESVRRIESYVAGKGREEFLADPMLQDAVIRQLELIGEAAKRVSEAGRSAYPRIPWRSMAAMRDKLIHGYLAVDLAVVWETVRRDLPLLKADLMAQGGADDRD